MSTFWRKGGRYRDTYSHEPVSHILLLFLKKSPGERKQIYHFSQARTTLWNYIMSKMTAPIKSYVHSLWANTLFHNQDFVLLKEESRKHLGCRVLPAWICQFREGEPGLLPSAGMPSGQQRCRVVCESTAFQNAALHRDVRETQVSCPLTPANPSSSKTALAEPHQAGSLGLF